MTQTRPGWVEYRGRTLYDAHGSKIGRIVEIYLDQEGGQAEWALVHTGLLGTKQTFVPLRGAQAEGDDLRAQVRKEQAQEAPHIDADSELSEGDEQRLFQHYEIPYTDEGSTTARGGADSGTGATGGESSWTGRQPEQGRAQGEERAAGRGEGHDVSGPNTDEAMTRSEEELRVGTETRERGRARLRKYVVTETETHTVPVSREEVRVEREPITEANRDAATDGPAISEEEHEVVLHEERPVVGKETVPKERVRVSKDVEREQEQVSDQVRKEQVETDDSTGDTSRGAERGATETGPRR
ncbi:PRC and DUF2382 domain-containing protein [Actinomycetospora lemnae]|uniref:PRC and DUF2382 domain-containing protein n=1 Tax=Actinomycetospora lemnae TaxID=3019891 RepID=A0ABT5SYI1_9PSEU|nr:PRC and DUF2382 domain-containing protein [Actinomycetospora sp. DW7H6]MDD7967839.1 PRC and DUF2382 domain-containing protein [Actinomycetospora sp. DW7H6]